jgi:hypothetical protein
MNIYRIIAAVAGTNNAKNQNQNNNDADDEELKQASSSSMPYWLITLRNSVGQ